MILLTFSRGFLWILGGAVAGGIVYTVIMVVRYRNSPTWPAADGKIESLIEVRSAGNHGPYYGVLSYSYVTDEYYSGEWMTPSFPKEVRCELC